MKLPWSPWLIALLSTVVLAVAMALVLSAFPADYWTDFQLSKAGLTDEYCERNRFEALIRQPVNAWSNLCYFFLGVWMVVVGLRDLRLAPARNPLQRFPGMSLWLGAMQIGLCFGSFLFHASVTRLGQHWDMNFTYAVALGLVVGGGYRWSVELGVRESGTLRGLTLAVALCATVLMALFKWRIEGKIALPVLMLLGLVLVVGMYFRRRSQLNGRLLLVGILALVLSGICRSFDLAKIGCDPEGWLQLHAFWHLFTGLAAFVFWRLLHEEQ